MRIVCGFFIVSIFATSVVCQTESSTLLSHGPTLELSAYARFFSEVAALRAPTEPVYLNGQLSRLRYPALQESVGFSDSEAEYVQNAAVACERDLRTIERSGRAVTLTARLDSVDSQTAEKATQFGALLLRRNEVIRSAVEDLKAQVGSTRFSVLERFLTNRLSKPRFLPLR
jgi:hypothetical protein